MRAREDRWLVWAAGVFALAVVIHNGDHVRRGADAVGLDVFWAGTLSIGLEAAIVALVCARHRWAPLAATVGGASLAAGYLVVHFLPSHPLLSDSFVSGAGVSPVSWFAASFELVAATALAVVGFVVLRRRGGLASVVASSSASRVRPFAGVGHPLVVAFAATQALTLAASFAQR